MDNKNKFKSLLKSKWNYVRIGYGKLKINRYVYIQSNTITAYQIYENFKIFKVFNK